MKATSLVLFAIMASALAIGNLSAQSATSFAGIRLMSQQDAKHTKSLKGTLSLDGVSQQMAFTENGGQAIVIPYTGISTMRLDSTIERLQVPFSGRVQSEEFLTVQYRNSGGKPAYAVFQLSGRSFRDTVAALESQTGKQVERKAE